MKTLEQRLQSLNDLELVRFALKYRKTMPDEHAEVLEEVIKDRISPDRWTRLCEELARDSVFQEELRKTSQNRLDKKESSKTQQWWLYALIGTGILALAAYLLQPYFS
ncbi:MAG: hypothetical protein FJZ75_08055 [Bacteroidetes bacterium]|nr:hypothetical protein [Bacteroidota bacterium]